MKRRFTALALSTFLIFSIAGCRSAAYQVHPGSPNTFDSQTYDILVTTDAAIQQTKTELANGTFTGTLANRVATALNDVIAAYNAANVAYQAYHAAAIANPPTATVAQANDLQSKTTTLTTSVSNLNNVKAGK